MRKRILPSFLRDLGRSGLAVLLCALTLVCCCCLNLCGEDETLGEQDSGHDTCHYHAVAVRQESRPAPDARDRVAAATVVPSRFLPAPLPGLRLGASFDSFHLGAFCSSDLLLRASRLQI